MEAPKLPGLFKFGKTNNPKRFNYTPFYYDEQKERLEERKKALGVTSETTAAREDRLRESMRSSWERRPRTTGSHVSTFRFLIILSILCLGLYYTYLKFVA